MTQTFSKIHKLLSEMHRTSSTTSTASQASYLGGVSPTHYIEQWNRLQLPNENLTTDNIIEWQRELGPVHISHRVAFNNEAGTSVALAPLLARTYCHVIVDQIPDKGIFEALGTLTDIRDFNLEISGGEIRLLPTKRQPIKGKIGKRHDTPVISLPNPAEDR